MSDLVLVPNYINANIEVLGNKQSFTFDKPISRLQLINKTISQSNTSFGFLNSAFQGFGFAHVTDDGDQGKFELQVWSNAGQIKNPVFTATQELFEFKTYASGPYPIAADHLTTKLYVDNHTWTTNQITDFISRLAQIPLNTFQPPITNIDMGGFRITNSGSPINSTDLVNKGFLDSYLTSSVVDINSGTTGQLMPNRIYPGDTSGYGKQFLCQYGATGPTWMPILLDYHTTGSLPVSRLNLPGRSDFFLRGDGWNSLSSIDINTIGGQLNLYKLNFPSNSTYYNNPANQKAFLRSDGYWDFIDISSATINKLPFSRITGFPATTSAYPAKNPPYFLRDDGTWAPISTTPTFPIDINTYTSGKLSISRLNSYPNDITKFLRGDGIWSTLSYPTITTSNVSGNWLISRIEGYPGNSTKFLRGDGMWSPLPTQVSYLNYLPVNGEVNLSGYNLKTSGNVSAMTGTLSGNNLASYNSSYINVLTPIDIRGNRIIGLANPIDGQDPTTKVYVDANLNAINNSLNNLNYQVQSCINAIHVLQSRVGQISNVVLQISPPSLWTMLGF